MLARSQIARHLARRAPVVALMRRPVSVKSWLPESEQEIQRMTTQSLIHELTQRQVRSAGQLVPWFLKMMPESYFRQVDYETRLDHLRALSALYGNDSDLTLSLKSVSEVTGERNITLMRPSNYIGLLLDLVRQIPKTEEGSLCRMQVFTSLDSSLCLNIFTFARPGHRQPVPAELINPILAYARQVMSGELRHDSTAPEPAPYLEENALRQVLERCDPAHLASSGTYRSLRHIIMYHQVAGTEGTTVEVHPLEYPEISADEPKRWVTIAVHNVIPERYLESLSELFKSSQLDIIRAYMNLIPCEDGEGAVTVLRFLVDTQGWDKEKTATLVSNIKRLKFMSNEARRLAMDQPSLGFARAEVITALISLSESMHFKDNPIVFSHTNIMLMLKNPRFLRHGAAIADLFLQRFYPGRDMPDSELERSRNLIISAIDREVEDAATADVLRTMARSVENIYRTNCFMENRFALSIRVKPEFLQHRSETREVPYGVFFVHGHQFNGFHLRFRDIARGGLRIVTPNTPDQFSSTVVRHYDEVFSLAYAQQLKNKDIPEGGSKAVIVVDTLGMSPEAKNLTMRGGVRAFTDAILDLIVTTDETKDKVKDYYGRPEILYLGPDEQVIPEDLAWIVQRAERRGLPLYNSFISSKRENGINHKEFGVTSEGVIVFLDVALRHIGFNPEVDTFTIKMTGGPDGDVGGNCIKILNREYGERARIVGIADGSGSAEDPNGLDMKELLRLVDSNLPIVHFDRAKLGPRGMVSSADTPEGFTQRNTLHNRVVADAFIPAGGRPNTISEANWKQFLLPDGTPSSKLIVEGANLFVSPPARELLFSEAKVMIVKDSSANKCGVICSSYEIIASMLIDKEEFVTVKKELVADVVKKLRQFARSEAELLFREYFHHPGALPKFSEQISRVINRVKDGLILYFEKVKDEDMVDLIPIFKEHLPEKLREMASDRILEKVPPRYLRNAIASSLASHIVYREGSVFTATISDKHLVRTVLNYHKTQSFVDNLVQELETSTLTDDSRAEIIRLLRKGGVRTALNTTS